MLSFKVWRLDNNYQEWFKLFVGVRVPLLEIVEILEPLLGRLFLSYTLKDVLEGLLVTFGEPEKENLT